MDSTSINGPVPKRTLPGLRLQLENEKGVINPVE